MEKKICPICETNEFSIKIYNENLPSTENEINFSGGKKPDGYHYEMLRCKKCSLLYASQIYTEDFSNKLYLDSDFNNIDEIQGLKKTYSYCLKEGLNKLKNLDNFLEIGCGNGFMLEEALKLGFKNAEGIEPSLKAINYSSSKIRNFIKKGIFDYKNYKKNHYDLVFTAMIIEHVTDINDFLSGIYEILKPEGIVICICHNERHFLSRLLKNSHPIINDEHVYVFSPIPLRLIYNKNKFEIINLKNLKNFYSLKYWMKMLPINRFIKKIINFFLNLIFGKKDIGIKAGNLYLIAKKIR